MNKKGDYAGVRAYEGAHFAVADSKGARLENFAYLFKADQRPKGKAPAGAYVKP